MKKEELRRFIPEKGGKYDVIVVGGGPAGLGAAYASAVSGAKTLLLESKSFFGGVASVGLWMPMNRMMTKWKSKGGANQRLIDILDRYQNDSYTRGYENAIAKDGLDIHPDYLRVASYELLEDVSCSYLLYSPVTDVIMDRNRIKGVIVKDSSNSYEFFADIIIDATGNADIAYLCGAPTIKGRESDNKMMPMSLSFALTNVDDNKVLDIVNNNRDLYRSYFKRGREKGYASAKWYFFDKTTVKGTISVNNGGLADAWEQSWNLDSTKISDCVLAERIGIKVAVDFVKMARDLKIPGMENCRLMRVGASIGIRDGRRIVGEYVQTKEDIQKGTRFDDVIAVRYVSHLDSQGMVAEEENVNPTPYNQVSYKCLIPQKIDGLLVAGRCSSFTHVALCAGRSMGVMMAIGQGAGIAAAQASTDNVSVRDVDIKKVQKKLENMGVNLMGEKYSE